MDLIGPTILPSHDFEQFYKETFDELFEGMHRYAVSLLKDNELALDTVQMVFIKWWETKKRIDDKPIKFYLYTAVYRQCLNAIRNERTKISHYKSYSLELAGNSGTLDNDIEFQELDDKIREAVLQLPPQCSMIFQKSRFENKRYSEIADEMSLSIKTVEAQIGKALRILRQQLSEYL